MQVSKANVVFQYKLNRNSVWSVLDSRFITSCITISVHRTRLKPQSRTENRIPCFGEIIFFFIQVLKKREKFFLTIIVVACVSSVVGNKQAVLLLGRSTANLTRRLIYTYVANSTF